MFPSELEKELSIFIEMAENKNEEFGRFSELFVQNLTEEQIDLWERGIEITEKRIEEMRKRFEKIKKKFEEGEIGNNNSE